ncbi:MAG: hypothetical protein HY905_00775 [Deltaproteobacteria bacterium]|nr:hypothetical protein [Deltaproteobacteria bacterium]
MLFRDFVDLRVRLGNMLTEAQRVPEATKQHEEAVRIKPEYRQAKIQLGIALLKAGRKPDAIALWCAVLEKDPASRSARMYLRLAGEKVDAAEKTGA